MIFLSASIPVKERGDYYLTADNVAIREAVKALAAVVLPRFGLVWGGHPAISPLIRYVLETMDIDARDRVVLYQSRYFESIYYEGNRAFGRIIKTDSMKSREESLEIMRTEMVSAYPYKAAVFIGGMNGVHDEFTLFRQKNPHAPAFPVASTGGAALKLYKDPKSEYFPPGLATETGYYALFTSLFNNIAPDYAEMQKPKI